MIRLLSLLSLILFLFSCSAAKKTTDSSDESLCTEKGVFRSFDGLSACNLLLVLEDGRKLQVVGGTAEGVRFSDGMEVKVGFEEVTDMASACMAADMLVRIKCIEVIVFPERECANKVTVFRRNWMLDAIQSFKPTEIRMIETDSINWFKLGGPDRDNIIFDCLGKMHCLFKTTPPNEKCKELNEQFSESEIIWVENN